MRIVMACEQPKTAPSICPSGARMMQAWADYLDALRKDAQVIPIVGKADA